MAKNSQVLQVSARRDSAIDVIRLIGIIAIVATHAFSNYQLAHILLYTWQVPLFFVLSGWFWKTDVDIRNEMRHRFQSLMIPYLSWAVLLLFIEVISMSRAITCWE